MTTPATPRRAARERQNAKEAATRAMVVAKKGARISFAWRVVPHDHQSDDGWTVWNGTVEEVVMADDVVKGLIVRYDASCEELEEEIQEFPPTPDLLDLLDKFEMKDIVISNQSKRGLKQKPAVLISGAPHAPATPIGKPPLAPQAPKRAREVEPDTDSDADDERHMKGVLSRATREEIESMLTNRRTSRRDRNLDVSRLLARLKDDVSDNTDEDEVTAALEEKVADKRNRIPLFPGLTVPRHHAHAAAWMYPQGWLAKLAGTNPDAVADSWRMNVDTFVRSLSTELSPAGLCVFGALADGFRLWLVSPAPDVRMGLNLISLIMMQIVIARNGTDGLLEFNSLFETARSAGHVDFVKILGQIKAKKYSTSNHQPKPSPHATSERIVTPIQDNSGTKKKNFSKGRGFR